MKDGINTDVSKSVLQKFLKELLNALIIELTHFGLLNTFGVMNLFGIGLGMVCCLFCAKPLPEPLRC